MRFPWIRTKQSDGSASAEKPLATNSEPGTQIYRAPPGAAWRPLWDAQLNVNLTWQGQGWQDFMAIELWRNSWPKAERVFVEQILRMPPKTNIIGLYWRPLFHARFFGGSC